jgi:hypothetical protein
MDIKDTLLKILDWIGSSPLRLALLIVLGLFGMIGWFVYTEKDAFMASYRAQQALPHMNGQYQEAADFIIKQTDADLVAIFEVNPLLNTRKMVYLFIKGEGVIKKYNGYDVGLFTKNTDNNADVISLMAGQIPCGPYLHPQSYIGFVYKEKGVNYMCRMSVPPDPSKFIGQISVGWKEIPNDEKSRTVLSVASTMLWTP